MPLCWGCGGAVAVYGLLGAFSFILIPFISWWLGVTPPPRARLPGLAATVGTMNTVWQVSRDGVPVATVRVAPDSDGGEPRVQVSAVGSLSLREANELARLLLATGVAAA